MSKGKVLVVGSNATRIEIQGERTGPTGQYLNETVVPVMAMIDAGYDVVLATPDGTKPHIDPASDSAQHFGGDEKAFRRARTFFENDASMNNVRTLRSVIEAGLGDYAGVFVPGGQAPVVDLMQDAELGEILRYFHTQQETNRASLPWADSFTGRPAGCQGIPRCSDRRGRRQGGGTGKGMAILRV